MVAKDIEKALENYYKDVYYFVPNIYFFGYPYKETDILVVKNNGYLYDVEIKVSKADYFADFKKIDKHSILKKGFYTCRHNTSMGFNRFEKGSEIPKERPNRFYFAVPENLISVKDLPDYAGLFYIKEDGSVEKIKEGKLLHKEKLSYSDRLCRKFYFYWKNCK